MFGIKRSLEDALFSDYIRGRDGWKCQVCGRQFDKDNGQSRKLLDCAHCFERRFQGSIQTRWEPDNAASMCKKCHFIGPDSMDHNVHEKREWFKKRLGVRKYNLLEYKAMNPGKFQKPDKVSIKLWLKVMIKGQEEADRGHIFGAH